MTTPGETVGPTGVLVGAEVVAVSRVVTEPPVPGAVAEGVSLPPIPVVPDTKVDAGGELVTTVVLLLFNQRGCKWGSLWGEEYFPRGTYTTVLDPGGVMTDSDDEEDEDDDDEEEVVKDIGTPTVAVVDVVTLALGKGTPALGELETEVGELETEVGVLVV